MPSLSWRAQDGHDEAPQNGKHSAERSARVLTGRCWMAENFPVRSLLWLPAEAHARCSTRGWCTAHVAPVSTLPSHAKSTEAYQHVRKTLAAVADEPAAAAACFGRGRRREQAPGARRALPAEVRRHGPVPRQAAGAPDQAAGVVGSRCCGRFLQKYGDVDLFPVKLQARCPPCA